MHTILEGICRKLVQRLFSEMIRVNNATIDLLNSLIQNYPHGQKIPIITQYDFSKGGGLTTTANQMKKFFNFLPFILEKIIIFDSDEYK